MRVLARVRAILFVVILLAIPSEAAPESIEGSGRLTFLGTYRWVPNWYFDGRAAATNHKYESPWGGGPGGIISGGYGVTKNIEITLDLFGLYNPFKVTPWGNVDAVTYGASVGGNFVVNNLFFDGFFPYIGAQGAFVLVNMRADGLKIPERVTGGLVIAGGFHLRFHDAWAFTLDIRWMMARSVFPQISGINAGGLMGSIGVTYFFAPQARTATVPGFDRPGTIP